MTAGLSNELTDAIFKRVEQLARDSGVVVKLTPAAATLKLEFVDGQRILLNHDAQTHKIWLAAGNAGAEYHFNGQHWSSAQDGSELFARLAGLIQQVIHSNPVNAQGGKTVIVAGAAVRHAALPQQEAGSSPLRSLLLLGLLLALGYAAFQHFSHKAPAGDYMAGLDIPGGGKCDGTFPNNGSTHIFPAGNIQPDNPNDTEVTLKNEHSHPFLAIFTAPRSVIPYLSVLVQANQSASIRLPAGEYDLMFSSGRDWCNLRSGFSDGQHTKLNTTLAILQQPMQISAQSAGSGASDFQVFLKSSAPAIPPPPTLFSGDGIMEIRQHSDGHFHIAGSVNGSPVTYLVDTGATLTSLSQATADRAGITDCKPTSFNTANGKINGCVGRVAQLTIGSYQMENAAVAVMPNMEVELLGMNVLSHFQISQANGVMRLAKR